MIARLTVAAAALAVLLELSLAAHLGEGATAPQVIFELPRSGAAPCVMNPVIAQIIATSEAGSQVVGVKCGGVSQTDPTAIGNP